MNIYCKRRLLLDLAGKLEMEGGALAPELSRQIVELTQP